VILLGAVALFNANDSQNFTSFTRPRCIGTELPTVICIGAWRRWGANVPFRREIPQARLTLRGVCCIRFIAASSGRCMKDLSAIMIGNMTICNERQGPRDDIEDATNRPRKSIVADTTLRRETREPNQSR